MNQSEAFLECRCGACRIVLCDPTVRAHVECLCYDCRQRGLISAARNPDNSLPEEVEKFERGIYLKYFANAFIVDDASTGLLAFSKLTVDGGNTTAMSTCCGTVMCGVHPLYEGTTISVNTDSCRVTAPCSKPIQLVTFASDIPVEHAAAIARHRQVPVLFAVFEELDNPAMQSFLSEVTEPVSASASAMATTNFEKLCAQKTVTIDNAFFKESRDHSGS